MLKPNPMIPFTLSVMLLSAAPAVGGAEPTSLPERDQIPTAYKWQVSHIYSDDAAWQSEFDAVKTAIASFTHHKGKLQSSSAALLQCLQERDNISMRLEKLYPYAHLQQDENTADSKYQSMSGKVQSLYTDFSAATSFVEPEILTIPENQLADFRKKEKGLGLYAFYFDNLLRQKAHILPPQEEELLSRVSEVTGSSSNVFTMLTNADMKFPVITDEQEKQVQLSEGRYGTYLRSYDRRVRQDAFTALLGTYHQYRNTLAATLNGTVKQHVFFAETRKYPTALDAALSPNNIPPSVYKNLVDTVNQNLGPLHRYVALKKKVLGLDEIHMYDLYVPLAKDVVIKKTYAEGLDLVRQALSPLGPEYMAALEKGLASGWVDVYENKGKRSGAYSWGVYGVHPFVLLNYNDRFEDVSTVAHEMGHAMHSYYSNMTQPYPTADYATFTAETASTTNEILLIDYMLAHTQNKTEKLYLLTQYLENIRTTVYRQTMFAEFEQMIHEKSQQDEPLTADLLSAMYHELNVKYFGPDMIVDKDIDIEWARIPHFYRNFYVYQYATGYSAASALAAQLQQEGPAAQTRYINNFLKAGGSDTPIHILQRAGVDMSSPAPIQLTLTKFNSLLDELETLLASE